jgi:hypothetical protein
MNEINTKENHPVKNEYHATPEELPKATIWPIVLAFGVLFFFWGLISHFILILVGIVSMGIAITGWITDLKNE